MAVFSNPGYTKDEPLLEKNDMEEHLEIYDEEFGENMDFNDD